MKQTTKPTPNNQLPIADLVVKDADSLLTTDILYRKEIGIKKYGTPLQPFNNRSALQDAYEETLDLAHYLKQKLEEEKVNEFVNGYPDW